MSTVLLTGGLWHRANTRGEFVKFGCELRADFSNLARAVVHECGIDELPEKAELFKFLLPAEDSVGFLEQPGVDIKAARAVADLHGALTADGYGGRDLEVLLTRLIFCFFGDDTGIFGENTQVHRLLQNSAEDGSDLGSVLSKLFEVLDTPVAKRSTKLPAKFADFAYVNGQLFSESCRLPLFLDELQAELEAGGKKK